MENIAEKVHEIFMGCLYEEKEVKDVEHPPEGAVLVEGIMGKFGFHPDRLESHRDQVRQLLDEMPKEFHKTTGGGWTFLNLCQDKNGFQWTGFHQRMEELVCLGIGLKMATFCAPRDMWSAFPGGMPYIVFDTGVQNADAVAPSPAGLQKA